MEQACIHLGTHLQRRSLAIARLSSVCFPPKCDVCAASAFYPFLPLAAYLCRRSDASWLAIFDEHSSTQSCPWRVGDLCKPPESPR